MSVYVYVPPVNPIRFVERDLPFTDLRSHMPYGTASYLDSLSQNEVNEPYYQPFKRDDILTLQIHRADLTHLKVNFYSAETKAKLHTVTISTPPLILAANTIPNTGGEQMYVQLITLQPSTYSALDDYDIVWIEIEANFSGTYKYLLSVAPVNLFTDNEEQYARVKYTCDTNKFDAFWANKNPNYFPSFTFYIEAYKPQRDSAFEHSTYDEMNGTTEELYSNVRDVYTLIVGGTDYMLDIMDRALACDNKSINGVVYNLKEVGEKSGKNPNQTKEYILTEPDDSVKYTFRERSFTIWERPSSGYPYAVGNITLLDYYGLTPIQFDARIIGNSGDESALVTYLNGLALAAGSSGAFSEDSGTFIFTNGDDGGIFSLASDVQVFPYTYNIDVNPGVSTDVYSHSSTMPDAFDRYQIINWGLGSAIGDDLLYSNNGTTAINVSNTYTSTGAKTIRVFHKNEEIGFVNNRSTVNGTSITNITGSFSSALTNFRLDRHNFSALTSLDLSFLAPAKDTLVNLVIRSSQLDGITATWASALVSGSYKPFTPIKYVDLSGNTFTQAFVDAFLNEFDASTNYQPGVYTLNIKFMSPAAAPTGTSASARANIAAKFWYLFTD